MDYNLRVAKKTVRHTISHSEKNDLLKSECTLIHVFLKRCNKPLCTITSVYNTQFEDEHMLVGTCKLTA